MVQGPRLLTRPTGGLRAPLERESKVKKKSESPDSRAAGAHHPRKGRTGNSDIPVPLLEENIEYWLLDSEISQLSPNTMALRRTLIGRFLWFLHEKGYSTCNPLVIREFLAYLTAPTAAGEGRWRTGRSTQPLRPKSVRNYYSELAVLFGYLVREGVIEENPMARIPRPIVRQDQIQPFTAEEVKGLIAAARRSACPRRDVAILLFLLDTGVRASELCALRVRDLDLSQTKCVVLGKGNKKRMVCFSPMTARAVTRYLLEVPHNDDSPVFVAARGTQAREGLTRAGLGSLLGRLGKAAHIGGTRCSPHTLRHTFAINFLRLGGNVFTLKELMGHTTLTVLNRYLAIAQVDLQAQHRRFSPVQGLLGKGN